MAIEIIHLDSLQDNPHIFKADITDALSALQGSRARRQPFFLVPVYHFIIAKTVSVAHPPGTPRA
jgi:hypothetical protein